MVLCDEHWNIAVVAGFHYLNYVTHNVHQGVVTAMCPVLPAATAIKVKSRDQAHRRSAIKGSRGCSGHKYDQNQNKMSDVIYLVHTVSIEQQY